MTLLDLNKGVCALVDQAAQASDTGAELVAEDVRRPILRPSVKVELEDGSEARAAEARVEREVTFRVYFFARDVNQPKLDNLAMRQALGEAFRDGIPVGTDTVPIDEGLSFTVTDGVLVATLDLSVDLELPESGEIMETLHQNLEVS